MISLCHSGGDEERVADFFDIIYLWRFFGFFGCASEGGVYTRFGFLL
jgi:hypothetical protein